MLDDLFIGIAVRKPEGFDPLPASIYGSLEKMHSWALMERYECFTFSDEDEAVTMASLEVSLAEVRFSRRRRIVFYFCGHGLFSRSTPIWVLSGNKNSKKSRLGLNHLVRELKKWGPKQIAIIGDACAEGVVGLDSDQPVRESKNPQKYLHVDIEWLLAAQDGLKSFASSEYGGLFTQLLSELLIEASPPKEAVSKKGIISDGLHQFVRKNFHLRVPNTVPKSEPGFIEPDKVYRYIDPRLTDDLDHEGPMIDLIAENDRVSRAQADVEQILGSNKLTNILAAIMENAAGEIKLKPMTFPKVDEQPGSTKDTPTKQFGIFEFEGDNSFGIPKVVLTGPPKSNKHPRNMETESPQHSFFDPKHGEIILGDDTLNGTMMIKGEHNSFLVPEFVGGSTWVSAIELPANELQGGGSNYFLPVGFSKFEKNEATPINQVGSKLLNKFNTSFCDNEFVDELLVRLPEAWDDPLHLIAVSYFAHRANKSVKLRKAILATRKGRAIPIDVALACNLDIHWDEETKSLFTVLEKDIISIITQIPLTAYGWSLVDMTDQSLPNFYETIASVRPKVTGSVFPILPDQETTTIVESWIKNYFSEEQILK